MFSQKFKTEWFSNAPRELLAGLVVALALIPEAIAFSLVAGVDPRVGLYASFCIAVTIAIVGGRPAMISAATGAMALVMVDLVRDHGLEYLLAASILTGGIQLIMGLLRLGGLVRFVSRSVITGFVNSLAILIFLAQMPELINRGWQVYAMVVAGLGVIYLFPRLNKSVPSPLVCIISLTAVSLLFGLDIRTVGDMGALPKDLPLFRIPEIPFTWSTFQLLFPYSCTLAVVGLLETMMTATIVDDFTETTSSKDRECVGQGVSNMIAGCFGGMAGCAMIGQSVINVRSGARGRLSTLSAGIFLLFLILVLGEWVQRIPMAALVAVMIMVSIGTFNWNSVKTLVVHPKTSSVVMVATVAVVVSTHDLAKGVLVGVLLSVLFFAMKVERLVHVSKEVKEDGALLIFRVSGEIFFASSDAFAKAISDTAGAKRVYIDCTHCHFWDISAISALDKIMFRLRKKGIEVDLAGLNEASATMIDKLALHTRPGEPEPALQH